MLIANAGFYLLFLCCVFSLYGSVTAFLSVRLSSPRFLQSAHLSAMFVTISSSIAAALLLAGLLMSNYQIRYIAHNTSGDLPFFYKITAFWSSQEGSHFLWTWIIVLFSFVAQKRYRSSLKPYAPYVSGVLQALLAWMFFIAITYSDVFALDIPAPKNGLGMNPLLQNIYMILHPPTLFIGYSALAVPFAYAMAALAYGSVHQDWLQIVRRWSLVSWIFLSIGIMLGGRWAYVELGWGGYWNWDPVENSSLMPWLLVTALLHSLRLYARRSFSIIWVLLLAVSAFFLSFFGTFITRSNLIISVHSFAESDVGSVYLLSLSVLAIVIAAVFFYRLPLMYAIELPAIDNRLNRDVFIAAGVLTFIGFTAFVFLGTMFPVFSEIINPSQKISVTAPYFNLFAPYFGILLLFLLSVGHCFRFRKTGSLYSYKKIIFFVIFAMLAVFFYNPFPILFQNNRKIIQLFGQWFVFFTAIVLTIDFVKTLPSLRFMTRRVFRTYLLPKFGSYLAHIGLVFAILGFFGNYQNINTTKTLKEGEKFHFNGYELTLEKGIYTHQQDNVTFYVADVMVKKQGYSSQILHPAKSKYPTKAEFLTEIAISSHFWHDLYVMIADFDFSTGKEVTFRIFINYTVKIVWFSIILMALGGVLVIFAQTHSERLS